VGLAKLTITRRTNGNPRSGGLGIASNAPSNSSSSDVTGPVLLGGVVKGTQVV
jgi:hypothetical protein